MPDSADTLVGFTLPFLAVELLLKVVTSIIFCPLKTTWTILNLLPIILEFEKILWTCSGVASVDTSKSLGFFPNRRSRIQPPTK